MALYFECKVTYDRIAENGNMKKVTDMYLVDALSFTEAEKVITQYVQPYMNGDFTVDAVKKTKVAEVFYNGKGTNIWYQFKVAFITIDEKTAMEKRTNVYMMVEAEDIQDAYKEFMKAMQDSVSDMSVVAIQETKILNVIQHEQQD